MFLLSFICRLREQPVPNTRVRRWGERVETAEDGELDRFS